MKKYININGDIYVKLDEVKESVKKRFEDSNIYTVYEHVMGEFETEENEPFCGVKETTPEETEDLYNGIIRGCKHRSLSIPKTDVICNDCGEKV